MENNKKKMSIEDSELAKKPDELAGENSTYPQEYEEQVDTKIRMEPQPFDDGAKNDEPK